MAEITSDRTPCTSNRTKKYVVSCTFKGREITDCTSLRYDANDGPTAKNDTFSTNPTAGECNYCNVCTCNQVEKCWWCGNWVCWQMASEWSTKATYGALLIQTKCNLHLLPPERDPIPLIKPVTADDNKDLMSSEVINSLATEINAELERRGKDPYDFTTLPKKDEPLLPDIIALLNDAMKLLTDTSEGSGGVNPIKGWIARANADPNPTIRTLNEFASACVCYADCNNYKACSCYNYKYR